MRASLVLGLVWLIGCAAPLDPEGRPIASDGGDDDSGGAVDTGADEDSGSDASTAADTSVTDTSEKDTSGADTSVVDTGSADTGAKDSSAPDTKPADTGPVDTGVVDTGPIGPITGGPCSSGAIGATAFRIKWAGSSSGSTAYPVYEVEGLPVSSSIKAGAYGYSIGYTPTFEDVYLGIGGLRLDSSSFVDIDFSTAGITTIKRATLSIFGRSFNTGSSGSYTWLTFEGAGATPSGAVANSAPYQWYGPNPYLGSGGPIGDMTAALLPGKVTKLRIKAGPPSGALIVSRIELCLDAE